MDGVNVLKRLSLKKTIASKVALAYITSLDFNLGTFFICVYSRQSKKVVMMNRHKEGALI